MNLEQTKQNRNDLLSEFRCKLIVQMYNSLQDKESYQKRVNKLIKIYLNKKEQPKYSYKKDVPEIKESPKQLPEAGLITVSMVIAFYNKIKNRKRVYIPGEGDVSDSNMFAFIIDKSHINEQIRTKIYENERKKFGEVKEAYIMSDLNKNRIERKIFYLCSKHADCAEDHKDYQGKLYVDKNWREYAKDKKAVENYIRANKIHEYQWVIGAPVYMLTRPNCRHFMLSLGENEVLGKTASSLIKENDMYYKVGRREGQTLPPLKAKRKVEIETIIKAYEDRLQLHTEMNKSHPNKYLKSVISKDVLLIKKWKDELKKL